MSKYRIMQQYDHFYIEKYMSWKNEWEVIGHNIISGFRPEYYKTLESAKSQIEKELEIEKIIKAREEAESVVVLELGDLDHE